jgi:hypothetical protein
MTRDEKYRKTQKRNRVYRTRRALRLIRRGQPKTVEEAASLLVGLDKIGQGAFRTAYRIRGTNLLIKFPLMYNYGVSGREDWNDKEGKNHTRMEVKKIRALMEFPIMRKHIPPVYYFNGRDGVMVTRYYPKSKWVSCATNNLVSDMVKEYCGVTMGDLSPDNLRTETGNLIFIDCGY